MFSPCLVVWLSRCLSRCPSRANMDLPGQASPFPGQHGLALALRTSPLHTCTYGGIKWLRAVFSCLVLSNDNNNTNIYVSFGAPIWYDQLTNEDKNCFFMRSIYVFMYFWRVLTKIVSNLNRSPSLFLRHTYLCLCVQCKLDTGTMLCTVSPCLGCILAWFCRLQPT